MQIRWAGQMWDVYLGDDGTMDTVIEVYDPKKDRTREARFDCEYASSFRNRDGEMTVRGLRELGREVIDDWWED